MSLQKQKKTLTNWDLVSVNPSEKNWDWKDLFCYWGVNVQSVIGFSLIVSLYVIYDLNTFVVFFGTLIGSFFVYLFSNMIGKPSQKTGLPFVVMLRTSLGVRGAKYFGLFRSLLGIFLFGIQTYFLSKAFSYLIRIAIFSYDSSLLEINIFLIFVLGLNIIDWFAIIIAIIFQGILFSRGMNFNKSLINISAITVYIGMFFFFLLILLTDVKIMSEAFVNILDYSNFIKLDNLIPLMTVAGTIFAYFSIVIMSFGDFSRYVKNEKELKKGNFSLIVNLIIFSFFALFIVTGSDVFIKNGNENFEKILTHPTDIIGTLDNLLVTILVLIFIIIASASTNLIVNFIPSQYTLINFMPSSLSVKNSTIIISTLALVVGIFWLSYLSQIGIISFLDTFGSFFGPIFGIMIIDLYSIRKNKINNKDIYSLETDGSYYYSRGWHIKGVYSLIIGFIFSASTIWNSNLMFLQSYSWIIGAFTAGLTYYLLAKE